ncbi:MAG: OmpA family protein [Bacteroidia bacterium]|nr:OmpA family protein [Bacteroidia bacterium]
MMVVRTLLLLIAVFTGLNLSAQQQKPIPYQLELDQADAAFKFKKYNTAANLYQKLYTKIKDQELKQKILFKIADSYRNSNNFKQALKWYEEVLNSKYPDPAVIYSYGQLLKNFERYEEAGRAFYDYNFEVPEDDKGKDAQKSCAVVAQWKANPLKYNVQNIKALNTEASDYSSFFANGKLYFTSARKESQGNAIFEWTGQKFCDLFESNLNGSTYAKPVPLKTLNTNFNEGVAWLDSNASSIYFTQCNGNDGKGINCKILVSYFQNGAWITPVPLPFNSDSFSCGHPAFTADGRRMYFSSDMPGGYGEKDIWYLSYDGIKNTWGSPVNLGKQVNSSEDELFPYVKEDGTIYYSSKGFTGMGGLDIFITKDTSGSFKNAENLKYPINSGGDDFGISFLPLSKQNRSDPIAFITSNREGGEGDDDLYSIAVKPYVFLIKGIVLERGTKEPIGSANVSLNLNDGKNVFKIKTNDKGQFGAELPLNQLMILQTGKEKYLSAADMSIDSRGFAKDSITEVIIYLDQIPSEDVELTLQGIYYDLDKYDIRPEARVVLDSLATILKNNPTLVIELASHTDSRAPAEYNLDLSKKRAQSCVNYLTQKGISKERMVPVGYGETKLVNDCSDDVDCTEAEHQQNRRTTIRVIRSDFKIKK